MINKWVSRSNVSLIAISVFIVLQAMDSTAQEETPLPEENRAIDLSQHSTKEKNLESLDFQNAEISDVVRSISKLTGKNFILDPLVKGKISIMAPSMVSVDEAYKAFLSALAINGFTVVPSGKFLKVTTGTAARKDSIETRSSRDAPSSDQMITRIIKLKHLSVNDVGRYFRGLISKDGDLISYEPTNSLIISDYGSNIRRLLKIINELDQPGFEEQMSVIPIRYAKAKDLAGIIDKIVNKGQDAASGGSGQPRFGGFHTRGPTSMGGSESATSPSLSLVTPDERTNSLIVLGNREGVEKVKTLVEELDFNLDPAEGGVFVYRLKHSLAENVAKTLNGLAEGASQSSSEQKAGSGNSLSKSAAAVFGREVKIVAEKNTNALIINASKQDFEVIRGLLAKVDVPRDQVYVEAIIMEVNSDKTRDWRIASYYLDPASAGVGRAGFSAPGALNSILHPESDSGVVLGFGQGQTFTVKIGSQSFAVPSLLSFVNLLQTQTDANVLSTPQILATDNEMASIEVGDQVPIGVETVTTSGGVITASPKFANATIKLVITPNISPDSNTVRMQVEQTVRQASQTTVPAEALRNIATVLSDRSIKTNISVESHSTVVLGGLIRDEETRAETKIPFLGDIPIIGWLFKSDRIQKKKINLLVFLTPKIVRSGGDARKILGSKIEDRKEWMAVNASSGIDPFQSRLDALLQAIPLEAPKALSKEPQSNDPQQIEPQASEGRATSSPERRENEDAG